MLQEVCSGNHNPEEVKVSLEGLENIIDDIDFGLDPRLLKLPPVNRDYSASRPIRIFLLNNHGISAKIGFLHQCNRNGVTKTPCLPSTDTRDVEEQAYIVYWVLSVHCNCKLDVDALFYIDYRSIKSAIRRRN